MTTEHGEGEEISHCDAQRQAILSNWFGNSTMTQNDSDR